MSEFTSILTCPECGHKLVPDTAHRVAKCDHKGGCKRIFTFEQLYDLRFNKKVEVTPKKG